MKLERRHYIEALKRNNLCINERMRTREAINASGIRSHGQEIAFSYIPLLLNGRDIKFFSSITEMANRIIAKVTKQYIEDPAYRRLFEFSEATERLILLPCNYDAMIPVGRYDIFFNEESGSYQFCEFNTDGSGGMSWDHEVTSAILKYFYDQDFIERNSIRPFMVTDLIAGELLSIYHSDKNAIEHPTFCITDFREEGVLSDFEAFVEAFKLRGVDARFTDIRDLVFDGQQLYDRTDGTVIHGIYRRAVTSVMLERLEECQGLIQAVKEEKVVLLGHFRTTVAHSKMIYVILHHKETMKMFSIDEKEWVKAHIPYTCCLERNKIGNELLKDIFSNKDNWVLKPKEGFASHGVVCGMDVSAAEWKELIYSHFGNEYLIQRFCRRYPVPVIIGTSKEITMMPVMTGIYCCNGHFTGCYNRAGNSGTIDYAHNGVCVATVMSGEMLPEGFHIGIERENHKVSETGELCGSDDVLSKFEFMTKDFAESQMEMVSPVFSAEEELYRWLSEKTCLLKKELKVLEQPEKVWPFSAPPALINDDAIQIAVLKDKSAEAYRAHLAEKYGKRKMLFCGIHVNYSAGDMESGCHIIYGQGMSEWRNRFHLNIAAGYAEYGWLITLLTAASPILDGSYFSYEDRGRLVLTEYASSRCSEMGYWNDFVPDLSFQSIDAYVEAVNRHIENKDIIKAAELYFPVRLKPVAGENIECLREVGIDHVEIRNIDLNPFEENGINLNDLKFIRIFLEYLGCTFNAKAQKPDSQRWTENFKNAAKLDLEHTFLKTADGTIRPLIKCAEQLLEELRLFYADAPKEIIEVIDFERSKLIFPKLRYAEKMCLSLKTAIDNDYTDPDKSTENTISSLNTAVTASDAAGDKNIADNDETVRGNF